VGDVCSVLRLLLPTRLGEFRRRTGSTRRKLLEEVSYKVRIGSDQRFEYAHLYRPLGRAKPAYSCPMTTMPSP